jgi:hypothetical protein
MLREVNSIEAKSLFDTVENDTKIKSAQGFVYPLFVPHKLRRVVSFALVMEMHAVGRQLV